jgi:hypothetical protein
MNNKHADLDAVWDDYRKMVVPTDAGPHQIEETRRAFYAGAACVMGFFSEMTDSDLDPIEGTAAVESLHLQLETFLESIPGGDDEDPVH